MMEILLSLLAISSLLGGWVVYLRARVRYLQVETMYQTRRADEMHEGLHRQINLTMKLSEQAQRHRQETLDETNALLSARRDQLDNNWGGGLHDAATGTGHDGATTATAPGAAGDQGQ